MIKGNESLSSMMASADAEIQVRVNETPLVNSLRQTALDSFLANGFNLRGREDWKYSDLKLFADGRFVPLISDNVPENTELPATVKFPENKGVRLVFINGVFSSAHSILDSLPEGVKLQPMARATVTGMGDLAPYDQSPFAALNTAFWNDGMALELSDGVHLQNPVHLHFLTNEMAAGKLITARNFIRAGKGSQATIIEHFYGEVGGEYLHAPVTEVHCASNSNITHLKIMSEDHQALHLGSTHVNQEADSRYTSGEFAMSGTMIRRELHLKLAGTGSKCELKALSMAGDTESRDMRTRVEHLVSGCETNELYKGLYDGCSKGIFDGKILVARDAQQTNANQSNRNLLLSDDAISYSMPRLEIYADDVKCTHGSTTGQLDDSMVFFLRSRGFDSLTARIMLAKAFANEILEVVDDGSLRSDLDASITDRLSRSLKGN